MGSTFPMRSTVWSFVLRVWPIRWQQRESGTLCLGCSRCRSLALPNRLALPGHVAPMFPSRHGPKTSVCKRVCSMTGSTSGVPQAPIAHLLCGEQKSLAARSSVGYKAPNWWEEVRWRHCCFSFSSLRLLSGPGFSATACRYSRAILSRRCRLRHEMSRGRRGHRQPARCRCEGWILTPVVGQSEPST